MIRSGKIQSFDPKTYVYTVAIDGIGIVYASQLVTGGDRRLSVEERALCAQNGNQWFILGSTEVPQPAAEELRRLTPEEAIASIVGTAIPRSVSREPVEIPTLRPYSDNRPLSSGDAVLAPKPVNFRTPRSFVRAYSFGSIDIRASESCYQFMDSKDNEIIMSARGFLTSGPGYVKSVTFKITGIGVGDITKRLVVREEIRADPLNETLEREEGEEARLDRETIEGFIPSPSGSYSKGPVELFLKPQVRRGRREVLSDYLVVEHDHDSQTIRKRLDRVDRVKKIRSLEIFHAEGYLTKEGPGLAVHGSRTLYRDWGLLEFDNDAGRMLLRVKDKTVVVDGNSISLVSGEKSGVYITNKGVIIKSDSILLDGKNVSVKGKNFSVEAGNIAMDSDLTSITANFAIIERAWGAHLTSGAIMMNSAMMIHHNTFTLSSLAQDVASVLKDVGTMLYGVVTFNVDKATVLLDKVFKGFTAAVDFVHAIASDAVQAAGILSKGFITATVGQTGVLTGVATQITTILRDPTVTLKNAGQFATGIAKEAVRESFETLSYTAVKGINVGEQVLKTFSETMNELSKNLENISKAIEKVKFDIPTPAISISGFSVDFNQLSTNMEQILSIPADVVEGVAEQVKTSAEAAGKAVGSALGNLAEAAEAAGTSVSNLANEAAKTAGVIGDKISASPLTFTSPTAELQSTVFSDQVLNPEFTGLSWADPTISYIGADVPPELFGYVPTT